MRNQCEAEKPAMSGRQAIWDIPEYKLCTVMGTCLELNRLRKMKNRFRKHLEDMPLDSDYDLHVCCVSVCRSKNLLSKLINRMLNQQSAQEIREIRSLKDDSAIRHLWLSRVATDAHNLAGYYWAIITSPKASTELKDKLYGEVHMISHISGQRRMNNLREREAENAQMQYGLKKKDRTIVRKKERIEQLRKVVSSLENQVRYLSSDNSDKKAKLQKAETSPQVYEQIIHSQMNCMDRLQTRVDKQKLEIDDLRQLLGKKSIPDIDQSSAAALTHEIVDPGSTQQARDLCGKKILYVGGFSRHRNKFQKLTEAINGCFLYHDGGIQQSIYQLDDLVKRADAIFCPIDCISHGAVDRIKKLSKTECKDCVFLRSASLSSFQQKVGQYAANN